MEYVTRRENGEWKKWFPELPNPVLGTIIIFDPRDNNKYISFYNVWISKSGESEKDFVLHVHLSDQDMDFNFLKELEKTGMFHYDLVFSKFGTPLHFVFHPALLSEIRRYA
jgi:hypothetical protein